MLTLAGWFIALASAGFALGYTQPKTGRLAWVFTISAFFALAGFDLQPFHPQAVWWQILLFLASWITTLFWLSVFLKVGWDVMEQRVPKHVNLLRSLG